MTAPALHTLQQKLCPWLRPALNRLEHAYAAGRLGHAWLVTGPAGIGKLNLALAFARRILERRRPTETLPDLAADEAVAALRDRHVPADHHADLHWLFPEEEKTAVSVEQIRDVAAALHLKAHAGGAKIVLVEKADRMTMAAANALLKTLEEPSDDTYLLLLADQPNRLPATIRSRCQRLVVIGPTRAELATWLGVAAEEFAAAWALTGGSPLRIAALVQEEKISETNKLYDELELVSEDKISVQTVADSWSKANPELALTWLTSELHREIRERLGSTSVTEREPVALHNAWRDLTLRRLFDQYEKADRLLGQLGSGINVELGLQAVLLGFHANRGST